MAKEKGVRPATKSDSGTESIQLAVKGLDFDPCYLCCFYSVIFSCDCLVQEITDLNHFKMKIA